MIWSTTQGLPDLEHRPKEVPGSANQAHALHCIMSSHNPKIIQDEIPKLISLHVLPVLIPTEHGLVRALYGDPTTPWYLAR